MAADKGGAAGDAALVKGNREFALDLFARLRERPGNLFFSPDSLSVTLAMTATGARGETRTQMTDALHLPSDKDLAARLGALLASTPKKKDYELAIANRLWGQRGFHFVPEFVALTQKYFGAALEPVDFASDASRVTINDWVAARTHDKIKDLIPKGALDATTRLVLTNAIYFKGAWAQPFDAKLTRPQPFFVDGKTTVEVPLMRHSDNVGYRKVDGAAIVELPYQGNDLSMVVILPDAKDGLAAVEKRLSVAELDGWLADLPRTSLDVMLPKFRMEAELRLASTLAKLGMNKAFSDSADFTGIAKEPLVISEVIHKAFVAVDERGTEAAAATGTVMRAGAVMRMPEFRADHPFLFLIRSVADGRVLFMGRVSNPKG